MNNIEIGKRIKQSREEKNMSLQDVADLKGVARSTVQRYEVGRIDKIKLPVIESIARALGVRPDWIIGKTNKRLPDIESTPEILLYYNSLNKTGKHVATEQVRLLTLDAKYTKSDNVIHIEKEPIPEHLIVQAAHNDSVIDDEELEKMQEDLELLKTYRK